jgi:hypothetical protein
MLRSLIRLCAYAAITLAAFLAAAAFLIFVVFDEDFSVHYATSAEARADRAIERGWLPEILPDSAFDIDEEHNIDTNRGGGTFHFAATDAETFRARLQPASPAAIARVDSAGLLTQGYSFHAFEDFLLAVNWQTREAEFWLLGDLD